MADAGSAIGTALSDAGIGIPKISMSGIGFWVMVIGGAIIVCAVVGFAAYYILQMLKWNKTVRLFKKVGNRYIPVSSDKAMFERVGTSGDYWLKTKKYKKTLPRPTIEMDKNTYWYYERSIDGEWINFEFGDIDEQMKQAKIHFIDEDMRLSRLGIQKNLKDRLIKETFWAKYGTTIMLIIFVLIVTIALVVLFQKMQANWVAATSAAVAVEHLAASVEQIGKNIQNMGGGTRPVLGAG